MKHGKLSAMDVSVTTYMAMGAMMKDAALLCCKKQLLPAEIGANRHIDGHHAEG